MPKLHISLAMLLLASSAQGQRTTARPSTDPWEITEQTNQPSLTLELSALNTVSRDRFRVRPLLVVRCQERALEVFVSTGSVLEADDSMMTPVRVQWGTAAPEQTRWSRSTDSMSAFAPSPRALLRQLESNPDLRVEIRPSGGSPQVIRFNVRGLDRHMPQVDVACRPKRIGELRDTIRR